MQEPSSDLEPSSERLAAVPASRRDLLIEVLVVYAAVMVACAAIWQLGRVVPLVGRYRHVAIAGLFLYVPTWLLSRRDEDFAAHGLAWRPVGRALALFAGLSAVIFPLFAVGCYLYYRLICAWVQKGGYAPGVYRLICPRLVSSWRAARLKIPPDILNRVAAQLIVVALPEEYFFRGYLQSRLGRVCVPRRRVLGGSIGCAVLMTSVLFALGHVVVDFNVLRLAVFFPSLIFGWLRQASGSILAGVLFHAASNLVSDLLHHALF